MSKHADDDPVIFGYSSDLNISFEGQDESEYTWGEWREMSEEKKIAAFTDHLWTLADVFVVDGEDKS